MPWNSFLSEAQLRAMAMRNIHDRLDHLLADANELGLVVTIELVPGKPLAMGNYTQVVTVREKR